MVLADAVYGLYGAVRPFITVGWLLMDMHGVAFCPFLRLHFTPHFLQIVVDGKASELLHVVKLWVVGRKGVVSIK